MAIQLESLETPALILDRAKLEANCARMRKHLERFQVNLRPHMKTAKSTDIARLVRGGLPGPITVSTLKEAEFFFASGFADILYAVGLVPSKFPRVLSLARAGCQLHVIVDTVDMALAFSEFCRKHDRERIGGDPRVGLAVAISGLCSR